MRINKIFFEIDPVKTVRISLHQKYKSTYFKQCTKCVMDNSINNLRFDKNGICEYCNKYEIIIDEKKIFNKKSNIQNQINNLKKSKKKYDAILGVSGGVDSSFLTLKCKEWGLNILLVHFDNGWNSNESIRNIKAIQEFTKYDLYTHVVDWEEFKKLQLSFLKANLVNFESPSDHGIFSLLYNVANEKKISNILTGINFETETFVEFEEDEKTFAFGYSYGDLYHLKSVYKKFYKDPLTTFPQLSYFKKAYFQKIKKIKMINILDYTNYKKSSAIEYLENLTNWKRYPSKHFESIITRFHQSFILPVKFGLDKRTLHLSNLIWSKQISRSEALIELKKDICDESLIVQDYYFFLKKLNLYESDFRKICLTDEKFFFQYPNSHKFFKILKKIKKIFNG